MSDRELVKLVTIDSVRPVEGSDNLELCRVGGWSVVSQKGLYKAGDKAWYHEIDSLLPLDNPAYEFLGARGIKEVDGKKYHRLKTVKLRGQISQGLLVPHKELYVPSMCNDHSWFKTPTEYLGVLKYDDVVTVNAGNSDTAGSFPSKYGQKTDSERIQNLTAYWDEIKKLDWYPSEKVDGCSLSVFCDESGKLRVCSRNWEIKEGNNVFWNAVRKYSDLFDSLTPYEGIQAEVYGEGIQKNRLGIRGIRIAIFNYLYRGQVIGSQDWPDLFVYQYDELMAPIYTDEDGRTIGLPDTVDEAIAQADGIKSQINPDRLAEGIVWTNPDGIAPDFLGRHNFKVISNSYLLKEK